MLQCYSQRVRLIEEYIFRYGVMDSRLLVVEFSSFAPIKKRKKRGKKNPRFSDAASMNCIQMDSSLLFKLIVSHALFDW
jgi:hypothetical protein